jgi:hypothetical protein
MSSKVIHVCEDTGVAYGGSRRVGLFPLDAGAKASNTGLKTIICNILWPIGPSAALLRLYPMNATPLGGIEYARFVDKSQSSAVYKPFSKLIEDMFAGHSQAFCDSRDVFGMYIYVRVLPMLVATVPTPLATEKTS